MAFFDSRTDEELELDYYGEDTDRDNRRIHEAARQQRIEDRLREYRSQYRYRLTILDESSASNRNHAGRELADILRLVQVIALTQ